MPHRTEKIIIDALTNILAELGLQKENISPNTIIYGTEGGINSLSLVRLIVDVEEGLLHITGKDIVLADDRSLSMKNSPFHSVETLTNYINNLINERE